MIRVVSSNHFRNGPGKQSESIPAEIVEARGMTDKQEVRRPQSEALHELHRGEDIG